MTIDDKARDENYNMILTEKQEKRQHYHHGKLINLNALEVKKCYL